jgi:hypothetical protein
MPRDQTRSVEWDLLTREEFERWVNALLVRKYRDDPELNAYAVDGRGGDDGMDVAVERGDDVTKVYQLKFYPEGMSNGFVGRRQKVKKSFERAAKITTMTDWYLVTPGDITVKERQAFSGYKKGTDIQIHFVGRADLDNMLAAYPEVLHMATYDPVAKALRDAGHAKEALGSSDDLAERIRALGELADSRDDYWGERFTWRDRSVISEVFAKRPDSASKSPVSIHFTASFGPAHQDLRKTWQQALEYGTTSPIILPPDVVTDFKIDGPEWMRHDGDGMQIEMHPVQAMHSLACEIRATSDSGATLGSLQGTIDTLSTGTKGLTFEATFLDCLTLRFRVPEGNGKMEGGLDITLDVSGKSASNALRVIRFVDLIEAGRSLQLRAAAKDMFRTSTFNPNGTGRGSDPGLVSLVEDLAYLEQQFGLTFAVPTEIVNWDRVGVKSARMLAEGRCIIFYGMDSLNATATRNDGEVDQDTAIQIMLSGDHAHAATIPGWQYEVLGQRIELGTLRSYHPSVVVDDAKEIGRRFGAGEPMVPIVIRPSDGTGFRVLIQERGGDSRTFAPERLNIPDLPEPDGFPEDPITATATVGSTEWSGTAPSR